MKAKQWKVIKTTVRGPVYFIFTFDTEMHHRDVIQNKRVRNWAGSHFIISCKPEGTVKPEDTNPKP